MKGDIYSEHQKGPPIGGPFDWFGRVKSGGVGSEELLPFRDTLRQGVGLFNPVDTILESMLIVNNRDSAIAARLLEFLTSGRLGTVVSGRPGFSSPSVKSSRLVRWLRPGFYTKTLLRL